MAITLDDMLESVRISRRFLLKHLNGVPEAQLDWKPYAECKSIRETLTHLVSDDIASRGFLQSGEFPNFESVEKETRERTEGLGVEGVLGVLAETHEELLTGVREHFADVALETSIPFWTGPTKLGVALAHLSGEDYYHAGQVAFVRMATDPGWDYYACVYGG